MNILATGGTVAARRGAILRNHGGNLAAPVVVQPERPFDLERLLEFPLTNNQFDNLGIARDWHATLNGPLHRYSGVRYQPTWFGQNADVSRPGGTAYPQWQCASARVYRAYRKGASGGDQRVLRLEIEHNTNRIRSGDQGWLYMLDGYAGSASGASSLDLGGFSLPLKSKLTVTGSEPSPDDPIDSRAYVDITFPNDLPNINYSPPTFRPHDWAPDYTEPQLIFVHHSFYADALTKRLRYPLSWHLDILKLDVLDNGGSVVVGGLQRLPVWSCWTTFANFVGNHDLVFDLYKQEQEGLANHFGDTDPGRLCNELENEAVAGWTDDKARSEQNYANPQAAIGLRKSLLEYMYPMSRAAWGKDRTLIVKGPSFGSVDRVRDWDIDVAATWPGDRVLLGNHNYAGSFAPKIVPDGRQFWYQSRADADEHARQLVDRAAAMHMDGAIMTEWSSPNTTATAERGREIGMLHTALAAKGVPVAYWDLVGDLFGFAWAYNDVPGSEGKTVQAVVPELRQYCGRAGRTSA